MAPGFNSPQWVLDELGSCNPLIENLPRLFFLIRCGKVTFTHFDEEDQADGNELPLPWNATYQAAWATFLQALAAQFNDETALVSIAVAGPTAVSAEMILPNGDEADQDQFLPFLGAPISPNEMWTQLLQLFYYDNPAYQGTDQAFIDAWDHAIDTYGEIFSGLTLVATTGDGLPNLSGTILALFTISVDFAASADCTPRPMLLMDCQAETSILEYYVQPYPVGGSNAKATQASGFEVSREGLNLGINGVKFLTQQTATPTAPAPLTSQILGGVETDISIAQNPEAEGSASGADQALYNVLQGFFAGTGVAGQYCEPSGASPLNYLNIYYPDITHADMPKYESQVPVISGCGNDVNRTFQGELNTASMQLLTKTSEP